VLVAEDPLAIGEQRPAECDCLRCASRLSIRERLVEAGIERWGMRGAEAARCPLDGAPREREPASTPFGPAQVLRCAVEQLDHLLSRIGYARGCIGERDHVREQLLTQRPRRRVRWVGRKRVLQRGDGAVDRARVSARASVVAHDFCNKRCTLTLSSTTVPRLKRASAFNASRSRLRSIATPRSITTSDSERGIASGASCAASASSSPASGALALAARIDAFHVEATAWMYETSGLLPNSSSAGSASRSSR
jgi:hypothetical protein